MLAAWLLTGLAVFGVFVGAHLGQLGGRSALIAAAGGGVLFGVCLLLLMPDIAESYGWSVAVGLPAAICTLLLLLDKLLVHTGHSPRHGVVGPLLIGTAIHSFLDGWSVRALSMLAVPIGLALHKLPEGVALGWITGKATGSTGKALLLGAVVEFVTLGGAWAEPHANRSGVEAFGSWWTVVVLAVVAGSFLFLGFHTVIPERKKSGVVPVFLATFAVVAAIAFANRIGVHVH
jgi:zinc transporter ZupT